MDNILLNAHHNFEGGGGVKIGLRVICSDLHRIDKLLYCDWLE